MSSSANKKPRVLFVGIDAADPDYIQKRIEAGGLPNLAKFQNEGGWARMRSTFPVLSSAAWSTIATGLPPEKHGIFEFFKRDEKSWRDLPIHGGMKKGKDFWEFASDAGLSSVVINMPITYPPHSVKNCVIVSGMDTPGEASQFVYPASEKDELFENIPDYRIELTAAQFETADKFLDEVSETMKKRLQAAFYLFDKHKPDLAVVIFTALDRVLHALWKYLDPHHRASERPEAVYWRNRVDHLYDQVDAHLGELLNWAGENTTTLVCSDHGGASVHGIFYLNRWLTQEGYLSVKGGGGSHLRTLSSMQKWAKRTIPRPIKNFANKIMPDMYTDVETRKGLSQLDPEKTKAYAWRKSNVIRLNLKGREPGASLDYGDEYESLTNEIKEKLENIVDPRYGRKPVRKVWLKSEAYPEAEPYDDAPDLVIEWADHLYSTDTSLNNLAGELFSTEELPPNRSWRDEINGDHALFGIFGVLGNNVSPELSLGEVDIKIVAPAVLQAAGIAIPSVMNSHPPVDLLVQNPDSKSIASDDPQESASSSVDNDDVYTKEEQEIIEKRLRDLGYM
ncbi:alkaline phosphatase family protein [bacterium]|nr:alkaline phosphatase family protein [bacterium]